MFHHQLINNVVFFLVIEYFTDKGHQYFNEGKNEDEITQEEPKADKKIITYCNSNNAFIAILLTKFSYFSLDPGLLKLTLL